MVDQALIVDSINYRLVLDTCELYLTFIEYFVSLFLMLLYHL